MRHLVVDERVADLATRHSAAIIVRREESASHQSFHAWSAATLEQSPGCSIVATIAADFTGSPVQMRFRDGPTLSLDMEPRGDVDPAVLVSVAYVARLRGILIQDLGLAGSVRIDNVLVRCTMQPFTSTDQ